MEKDFDSIDEKSRKIIELLTPKHFNHTMELKKTGRKHSAFTLWKHLTAAAAIIVITLFMGTKLLQPDSAYSMPATSKEILANAIKAIRELKSVSLEFNARIQSVTPDYAECSSGGTPAKCRYRLIQDKEEIIQRLDFDFDSIKVSNIYVNDSVYIWQDKELLYKGVKENPTGLKSIVKIENVLKKISDCNDIKMEKGERATTLKHETAIEGGTLVTVGTFDNRTGLLESCSNFFVYEGATFPIVESTKMEYNIPISKEEMLISP